MTEQQILYIEEKPIKRELKFTNYQDYAKFFNPYCQSMIDYAWKNNIKYNDYWVYQRHKLNKDGTIRKPFNPTHLRSKKAIANQRRGWLKYCERRKKETLEKSLKRKMFENQLRINKLMAENEDYSAQLQALGSENAIIS